MSALETRRAGTEPAKIGSALSPGARTFETCRRSESRRSSPPSPAAGAVLDAGCGSARLTLAFAEAGAADVVGIDTSLERLAQGRARLSAHRWAPA